MKTLKNFKTEKFEIPKTGFHLNPEMDICQSDYPLDWYQEEFIPYAQEYQALRDRKPETVISWMNQYIQPARKHFGDSLLLLAHYYMGGEIVKLVELFEGKVADSYQLALMAFHNPEKKVIVESAVHFMAETISILSRPDQNVYITNPKSGCTMEMNAKDYMVEPAFEDLVNRYGKDHILPICYMNTSGRIKALTGEYEGAVCTSSNVKKIFQWALEQNKKIFFIPDQYMGENVASWVGIANEKIQYWPGGTQGSLFSFNDLNKKELNKFDESQLVLFGSSCSVHSAFQREMVHYWKERDFHVSVHPECRFEVVDIADSCGSTSFLWDHVLHDRAQTKKYAVGTEGHFVENLKLACGEKNIEVVHLSEAKFKGVKGAGCGCATMSRNDPPHLVALLDLLRQGKAPALNQVIAGDVINEFSGSRERLEQKGQDWLILNAKKSLKKMIEITETK